MKALEIYRQFACTENLLVYQMGKVGSSSLEHSLPTAIHAHSLFGFNPCPPAFKAKHFSQRLNITLGSVIKRTALARRPELRIICPIREPMARNISMFFQDLPFWLCEHFRRGGLQDNRSDAGMSVLVDAFESVFCHDYPTEWFHHELKRLCGIDVFTSPFDKEQGWAVIEQGRARLLLIRHNALDDNVALLSDFCGQNVNLQRVNTGSKKWYGGLYKEFLNNYKPSEKLANRVEQGRFHQHFYAEK